MGAFCDTTRRFSRAVFGLLGAWIAAYLVGLLAGVPHTGPFAKEVHLVVLLAASALCLLRVVVVPEERLPWVLIGLGVLSWTLGEVYFTVALWDLHAVPVPSPADAGYLTSPVLLFAGVGTLARRRARNARRSLLVDGAIAALAVAAVSAAFVFDRVVDSAAGDTLAVLTNLAYPVLDLALLAICVGVIALRGWRLDRTWALVAGGIVLFWMADSGYLLETAAGSFTSGGIIDVGWWTGLTLVCLAAWQPHRVERQAPAAADEAWSILLPVGFAATAVAVLVFGALGHPLNALAVVLAGLSLAAVGVRLVGTFRGYVAMLGTSQEEARTDALTGLPNRRALTEDLAAALAPDAGDRAPQGVLALFDLDGFKVYNDSFGHQAGDALLERLGRRLDRYVTGRGTAYRMGGDEFCVLVELGDEAAAPVLEGAAAALAERGEGFAVTASWGAVTLPFEADTPESALRTADQRMYAQKHGGRPSAGRQSTDVLLRALAERHPDLDDHAHDVAVLAVATAERLGLDGEAVEAVRQAAELHDIGKVAIPATILGKPGPLDEVEWEYIRRHPVIGERIIAAAPSLTRIALMVRSSHERFDGAGYPDGLAGQAIPLGARIVAVCDAFDAMVTTRPYSAAISAEDARAELRRCASTQFDPVVVDAFCRAAAEAPVPSGR